uniref:Cell cycle progression 1 n=1 Tax=Lepisosteus oculatus TaxID=7918 RepID=W5N7K0_LEPOC
MSENSSDTESSCGWTIISNEGSDIETLGPENGGGDSLDVPENLPALEEELQDVPSVQRAKSSEERAETSLEDTLKEDTLQETLAVSEVGQEQATEEQVTFGSSSDHSDIVTLEPSRAAELGVWEDRGSEEQETGASEELYLGTSSSSQYSFRAPETLFPAEPRVDDSSSDESHERPSPVLRKRRVRRSTAPASGAEEGPAGGAGELEQEPQLAAAAAAATVVTPQGHVSGTLNKCILLALVIAISMGFGHFYGTVQIQERQKLVERLHENELNDVRDDLYLCQKEQDAIVESKSQKEDLALRLKQTAEERHTIESRQKSLVNENQHLKNSLEREEESLSTLQEELRNLRAQVRSLEEVGAGTDSIITENQRLKDHLEEEKQRIHSFLRQKETLMAEAQMLRRELDRERKVTDELKEELERMSRTLKDEGEADPETEELQARLTELEKKLNFEQQRSDLWERLYVETREENSKGDKPKKPKEGIFTKVKETFDAVKNSTKEFVHHHKEQIKKAKEAVKENLKKFSDSVKSTFRHFKDSATRAFDKTHKSYEKRYQERKDVKPVKHEYHEPPRHRRDQDDGQASWQHQHQRPFHRHPRKSTTDTYQAKQNMRKTGAKTCNKEERESHRIPKGCSGVFDCAYQESMSLFNKALDPIRADEFTQLIRSYLKKEVDHFHHWRELESFINSFFHNGVFIHDQMLFTDFVSGVEEYLEDMDEYQQHSDDVFEDLDEYVYRHFFGDTYSKQYGPSRPFEGPVSRNTDDRHRRQERKHQRAHSRHHRERKWSKPGRASGRHMANVKIELGPMPFDPKY